MKLSLNTQHLYAIAFSHKKLPLNLIGKLFLDTSSENYKSVLESISAHFSASEIMHLSTCNRCEFYIVSKNEITKKDAQEFFANFYAYLNEDERNKIREKLIFKKDERAVKYLMEVAASLQSMVVGEREIITQVRTAYDKCRDLKLTGDLLRLVMKKVVETAKHIFTETDIAKNPVSVASLAARRLQQKGVSENANVSVIGSGVTMQTFLKYFHQSTYTYTFISRNKNHSERLQQKYGGNFMSLEELKEISYLPTDVLIVCTSSPEPLVNKEVFDKFFANSSKAVIVDLSNPSDVAPELFDLFKFEYIGIASLKKQAAENLKKRKQSIIDAKNIIAAHLEEFMQVFKERCVENVIREIPSEFKAYKHKALNEVFRKKLENFNAEEQQIIREIMDYIEEKYNVVTYKKLKSILLQ
ncbi:MAG: glutamyl-tRNA reductase [Bacteroidetes bacterium]|nr:MAG: glutamyl-tRNA reductase [Bacteroidota bacterium]